MVNGLLNIESESGKVVIVMSDFWSTEGEFPNQISIKLAKKGNDINLKSVLRWKFYLASQEPHFVWVDVGDPIFSTWKSHTNFSTSIFFLFWNVPILSGVFGILEKYFKVEKLFFSNIFLPKYRFLHLQVGILGLSSDEYSN